MNLFIENLENITNIDTYLESTRSMTGLINENRTLNELISNPDQINSLIESSNNAINLPNQPLSSNDISNLSNNSLDLFFKQKYNCENDSNTLAIFNKNNYIISEKVLDIRGEKEFSFDGDVDNVYDVNKIEGIDECYKIFNDKCIESLTTKDYIVDRVLILNRNTFTQLYELYLEEKKNNFNINFKRLVDFYFLELDSLDLNQKDTKTMKELVSSLDRSINASNSISPDYSLMNKKFTDILYKDRNIVNFASYMKILNSMK